MISLWSENTGEQENKILEGIETVANNMQYRGDLTDSERIAYTTAVQCLMASPAKTPNDLAVGAKTRYDDWVVTHINQTGTIHATASFLGWHRWFTWSYEQALREECNYTGSQPYWDWTRTAETGMSASPLFDGSETSLSGDGLSLNYTSADYIGINTDGPGAIYLSAGSGGGCVTSGPFVNMTVNLGPAGLTTINGGSESAPGDDIFYYNPRCLKRSFTDDANRRFGNMSAVLDLLRNPTDIWDFENTMQGYYNAPSIGVHGGGHFTFGGDPGRDLYVSPGDPAFYTHHSMIDRVWWLWQMLSPADRTDRTLGINGPLTTNNLTEPYGNGTASDVQNIGYVSEGEEHELGDLLDTTSGMFCYVYE